MTGAALWDHSGDRQRAEDGQADGSCGREHKRTCRFRFAVKQFFLPSVHPVPAVCYAATLLSLSLLLSARVTVGVRGEKTRIVYVNYPEVPGRLEEKEVP